MELSKAVFLDRDGTVNIDKGYLFQKKDFEYIDGAVEGLRKLSDMGFLLVIITNQSGIARGYYTEQDYLKLETWLIDDLYQRGVKIAKTYYCPHFPNGIVATYCISCNCRKPKTGLFWKAQKELGIDMDRSFVIGDKQRDLSISKESGVHGILLTDKIEYLMNITVCHNWREIIDEIMDYEKTRKTDYSK